MDARPPDGAGDDVVLASIRKALVWRGFKHVVLSPEGVDFGARRAFASFGFDANATAIFNSGNVRLSPRASGGPIRVELRTSPLMLLATVACALFLAAAPIEIEQRLLGFFVLPFGWAVSLAFGKSVVSGWIATAVGGAAHDVAARAP